MGGAFTVHLVAAGYEVWVVDPSAAAVERARERGCRVADTVEGMWLTDPTAVLLSLATEDAFRDVVDAILRARRQAGAADAVVIDTSTLPLTAKEQAAVRLADLATELLDCPVSGTGQQALTRDLVVYASGDATAVTRCLPVLEAISTRVHQLGDFGLGTKMKLLANVLVGIHNAAAAEMLAMAERAGIDPRWALSIVSDGAGQSRMLEQRGPNMARHDYGYGASVDLFRKDLSIIERFARDVSAKTPLLDDVIALYETAARMGLGGEESAAVHRVYLDDFIESRSSDQDG